jgi:NAD-dependent dihydropyrimidine dehydrogenase PreA subunit
LFVAGKLVIIQCSKKRLGINKFLMVFLWKKQQGSKSLTSSSTRTNVKDAGCASKFARKEVLFEQPHLNRMGYHPSGYTGQGCIGCGHCFYACPEPGAISVYKKGYVVAAEEEK